MLLTHPFLSFPPPFTPFPQTITQTCGKIAFCLLGTLALAFLYGPARAATQDNRSEAIKSQDTKPEDKKEARKAIQAMEKKGWQLTFHDEFDGKALDTKNWIDSYPDNVRTHSNNEQQYYAPDGYDVKDGVLRLKAEKRTMGGMPYTSGMVTTYGKFAQQYGWFEIRAMFPAGKGMWPAFWLLPSDKSWPPEIDILEILGHEPDKVYLTNHYNNAQGKHEGKGENYKGPNFSTGFHTFAVDWEPAAIVWYVDGTERFRVTENVPAVPMYVLANLAVGGDWPGNPDDQTVFPSTMDIDYIRVYKHAGDNKDIKDRPGEGQTSAALRQP